MLRQAEAASEEMTSEGGDVIGVKVWAEEVSVGDALSLWALRVRLSLDSKNT